MIWNDFKKTREVETTPFELYVWQNYNKGRISLHGTSQACPTTTSTLLLIPCYSCILYGFYCINSSKARNHKTNMVEGLWPLHHLDVDAKLRQGSMHQITHNLPTVTSYKYVYLWKIPSVVQYPPIHLLLKQPPLLHGRTWMRTHTQTMASGVSLTSRHCSVCK
jgi:hypothetical protein